MDKKTCCSENNPFFIDYPGRIRSIQEAMARDGFDVYLGSRLRTIHGLPMLSVRGEAIL